MPKHLTYTSISFVITSLSVFCLFFVSSLYLLIPFYCISSNIRVVLLFLLVFNGDLLMSIAFFTCHLRITAFDKNQLKQNKDIRMLYVHWSNPFFFFVLKVYFRGKLMYAVYSLFVCLSTLKNYMYY